MPKFFLDANGGSLAFKKEADSADWDNSIYVVGAQAVSLPGTVAAGSTVLDVTNYRHAMILVVADVPADLYDLTIIGGTKSSNVSTWLPIDGGDYLETSGSKLIGVDCFGYDYLTFEFSNTSSAYSVEIAYIPYEENDV